MDQICCSSGMRVGLKIEQYSYSGLVTLLLKVRENCEVSERHQESFSFDKSWELWRFVWEHSALGVPKDDARSIRNVEQLQDLMHSRPLKSILQNEEVDFAFCLQYACSCLNNTLPCKAVVSPDSNEAEYFVPIADEIASLANDTSH